MFRTQTAPLFHGLSPLIAALTLGVVMRPGTAVAETHAAWVQLVGPGRDASIRVITDDTSCPALEADGVDLPMHVVPHRDLSSSQAQTRHPRLFPSLHAR